MFFRHYVQFRHHSIVSIDQREPFESTLRLISVVVELGKASLQFRLERANRSRDTSRRAFEFALFVLEPMLPSRLKFIVGDLRIGVEFQALIRKTPERIVGTDIGSRCEFNGFWKLKPSVEVCNRAFEKPV